MAMISGTTQITPGPDLVFIGPITVESMVKKTLALGREVIDELISTTLPPLPEPRDMNIAPTFNKDEQPSVNEMPQDFVAAVKNYEEMYRSIMLNPIVPKAEKAILELQHREVEKEVSVFNADQNISQSS